MNWLYCSSEFLRQKRRHQRKPMRLPASLILPSDNRRIPIEITDISEGGARIRLPPDFDGVKLEDIFDIFLANSEEMRRHCKVVRKAKTDIGVIFYAKSNSYV